LLEAAGDDAQGPKYADSFKVLGQGNRNRATGSRGESFLLPGNRKPVHAYCWRLLEVMRKVTIVLMRKVLMNTH
jgi:hypothetical protein